MSHWYHPQTAVLIDKVPNLSKPGQYRDATLRDARPLGLLPSVTTILSLLAKPGLVRWQVEQGIRATQEEFSLGNYEMTVADLFRKSEEFVRWTAEFGTATHWWLNKKLREVETMELPPIIPGAEEIADGMLRWFPQYGFEWTHTEKRFANVELGVGGSVDHLGLRLKTNLAIGDSKTQQPPLTPYLEHALQLAGYSLGLGLDPAIERWSFIANRDNPGEVKGHLWCDKNSTQEQTNARYDKMFLGLRDLYFMVNQYDPRQEEVDA